MRTDWLYQRASQDRWIKFNDNYVRLRGICQH